VASGVVSPEDLDVVMKDGLGPRYAFMGPMETIHLVSYTSASLFQFVENRSLT
jgi:L-gulonate 3-dehydrogenase